MNSFLIRNFFIYKNIKAEKIYKFRNMLRPNPRPENTWTLKIYSFIYVLRSVEVTCCYVHYRIVSNVRLMTTPNVELQRKLFESSASFKKNTKLLYSDRATVVCQ